VTGGPNWDSAKVPDRSPLKSSGSLRGHIAKEGGEKMPVTPKSISESDPDSPLPKMTPGKTGKAEGVASQALLADQASVPKKAPPVASRDYVDKTVLGAADVAQNRRKEAVIKKATESKEKLPEDVPNSDEGTVIVKQKRLESSRIEERVIPIEKGPVSEGSFREKFVKPFKKLRELLPSNKPVLVKEEVFFSEIGTPGYFSEDMKEEEIQRCTDWFANYFVANPGILEEEGFLRLAGGTKNTDSLVEALKAGKEPPELAHDPHAVATAFKRFFKEMCPPDFLAEFSQKAEANGSKGAFSAGWDMTVAALESPARRKLCNVMADTAIKLTENRSTKMNPGNIMLSFPDGKAFFGVIFYTKKS